MFLQGATTGVLDLSEYDRYLVETFLRFLYSGSYRLDFISTPEGRFVRGEIELTEEAFDLELYNLGVKYDVPDLKTYICDKFLSKLQQGSARFYSIGKLVKVIPIIYQRPIESYRPLRDAVVLAARHGTHVFRWGQDQEVVLDQLREVLRTVPDFGLDFFASLRHKPILLRCRSCGSHEEAVIDKMVCKRCRKSEHVESDSLH